MKNILFATAILLSVPAYAQDNIDVCNNCRITYSSPRTVVKKVVRPAPPPVAVEYVPAGPGPISSTIAVPVVVPVQPQPVCTTYPDPWDTLGWIFGDPYMITTCY